MINVDDLGVLVIGGGGREHALTWKFAQSPHVKRMWCAPGSNAIAGERLVSNGKEVSCVPIGVERLEDLRNFARDNRAGFTIVGPDNPLGEGIVDLFKASGLTIWGPNRKAAQFETSKVHTQKFAERHGVSIAPGACFEDVEAAKRYAESLQGLCVPKADGLALGKGALPCGSVEEAHAAIESIMVKRDFGNAGRALVIQERLPGREFSLHALSDGKGYKLFPTSQDHKRAQDGDKGLNTGGMGTYSPVPFLSPDIVASAGNSILKPWQKGCLAEGIEFRGMLYPNVMLTPERIARLLEFNVRFGDPETQVYMTRLKTDLVELLWASANGSLQDVSLEWEEVSSVCVVMASGGYPEAYKKGKRVEGLDDVAKMEGVKVFHADTIRNNGVYYTNGGRVLGVTAWAKGLPAARALAYEVVGRIKFEGRHFRTDIADKAF